MKIKIIAVMVSFALVWIIFHQIITVGIFNDEKTFNIKICSYNGIKDESICLGSIIRKNRDDII